MTTWITRFDAPTDGRLRVAVKDAIDVAGTVTTAGCAAARSADGVLVPSGVVQVPRPESP